MTLTIEDARLYVRLGTHYRQAIRQGTLPPGARMPSVRGLMALHGVSMSTALQACRWLEGQGLLEARARAGYFVAAAARQGQTPRLPPAHEPAVAAPVDAARYVGVHQKVSSVLERALRAQVRVNLAGAVAAPDLYPLERLRQASLRVLRHHALHLVTPSLPGGEPSLRAALARHALEQQLQLRADEIVVTHGCTEALTLALRAVTQPGDVVAVESPTYYGLLQILESLSLQALEIPTSPHTGISLPALREAAARTPGLKAVAVIPNLQNPLGAIMPEAAKQELLAWCEAQDLALIEDDSYASFYDGPGTLRPIKSFDRSGRVILCSSLHKILAPGMRLGWMTGGRWQQRLEMLKYSQSRPNEALAQLAVADFFKAGHMTRHLRGMRARLAQQREQMAEALARHLPRESRMSLPSGGLSLWVELPEGSSSEVLFEAALAQGIRLAPGAMFSNSMRYDRFLRINCGLPFDAQLREAVACLGRLLAPQRAHL
ncbi:DNA-binding transcriptional MocR family regulator [Paucibacter oligotrophus]|uniref:DNA-binding transcriptional MocR family regulator n=1 Tax=Roseateles oligotrophus TaxID=1769250 RepID=A0A840LG41_9BURK|nr:PLP-dependent aminotransferase family protein [Roseateles oligotrophus]MBB4846005.1 DNA-binding transcriptional MocR family regulator [Roseateles oligotrophus]